MRRGWIRLLLTEKRLFKTPSYLLVLLSLPLLMLCMHQSASEEKGMLTIALYADKPADLLADHVIEELSKGDDLLSYTVCDSEEAAKELVTGGKADAAWIFDADLGEKLREAAEERICQPVVHVFVLEDNVALQFSREILARQLFPTFLYDIYEDEVLHTLGINVSEEELRRIYDRWRFEGSLFSAEYPDGDASENADYLLSPLRGLMAVWIVISGFAAVLYHKRDEQRGAFAHLPYRERGLQELYLLAVVLGNSGIAFYAGCLFIGVLTKPLYEILLLLLYLCCTAVFCMFVGWALRKAQLLGAVIPAVIILLLALSPIFFGLRDFWMFQMLLPTYLYLNSVHGFFYAGAMAVYALAGVVIWCVYRALRHPARRKSDQIPATRG